MLWSNDIVELARDWAFLFWGLHWERARSLGVFDAWFRVETARRDGECDPAAEVRLCELWQRIATPTFGPARWQGSDLYELVRVAPFVDEVEAHERGLGPMPTQMTLIMKNKVAHCVVYDVGVAAARRYGYRARGSLLINESIGLGAEPVDRDLVLRLYHEAA